MQKVYVRLTCAAQKRGSRLKVLLKITTENGIYSHPMKVISNTILFVYSLRGALIKIARGCYTWWRNYFDGTTRLTAISTPWGRGWHVHQPTAWPVPNSCAKPNHPGVGRQQSQPRGVLIRDHQNMKYQQVHSDKPISMIKPSDLWTADSSSWNSFHVKSLQTRNCKGSGLLSHWRSCLDSWACANHILRSRKLTVGFNTHIPLFWLFWFHYSVEVLFTVRSNIYYLSHP